MTRSIDDDKREKNFHHDQELFAQVDMNILKKGANYDFMPEINNEIIIGLFA